MRMEVEKCNDFGREYGKKFSKTSILNKKQSFISKLSVRIWKSQNFFVYLQVLLCATQKYEKHQLMDSIKKLIGLPENAVIEYKSAKGGLPASLWESYSSFANSNGGIIVLGIKEKNGHLTPDDLTEDQLIAYKKNFWDIVHNRAKVSATLVSESDVTVEKWQGTSILVIKVPRARFDQRPVFLNHNPLGNTYIRNNEGDYLCSDEEVRIMFADAQALQHSHDADILPNFTMEDIDIQSVRAYRQRFSLRRPGHPWNEIDDMAFLTKINAYSSDRKTKEEGFTRAGILMFGKYASITDRYCAPWYFPDYQEWFGDDTSQRWTNRIYPDSTWEPNLYQFFHRVYTQAAQSLPTKFALKGIERIDDTSAHVALREALVNTLVHCNYAIQGNILIKRISNGFIMRNPGRMLISVEDFYAGSHSTCRNPLIQNMFSLLGYGEHAGSGADIIVKGWMSYGWERPKIVESVHPEETTLSMMMGQFHVRIQKNEQNVPSDVPSHVPSNVPSHVPSFSLDISRVSLCLSLAFPTMKDADHSKALKVILALYEGDLSMQAIMSLVGDSNRSRVRKNVVAPLTKEGLIAQTVSDKQTSPDQTYQLTELSQSLLKTPDYITDPQSLNAK